MSRLHRKKGRKSNYVKSLNSNEWKLVKRKVRIRDNFTCIINGCGNKSRLETHHISYMVYGFSIVGHEIKYLDWIATLCEDCHRNVHKTGNHVLNHKNPFRITVSKYKELYLVFDS